MTRWLLLYQRWETVRNAFLPFAFCFFFKLSLHVAGKNSMELQGELHIINKQRNFKREFWDCKKDLTPVSLHKYRKIPISLFILEHVSIKIAPKSERQSEARFCLFVCLFIQFIWGFTYFQIKNTSGHWILCILPTHHRFLLSHTLWKNPLTGKEDCSWPAALQDKLQISESPSDLIRHLSSVSFATFFPICIAGTVQFHSAATLYSLDYKIWAVRDCLILYRVLT